MSQNTGRTGPDGKRQRARAPRGSITRQRVVQGALELIDADGLVGLTMPRLAQELGIGTMSLYRHVTSKADLLEALAGLVFSELEVPRGDPADWQTRVVGYLVQWRAQALAHPAIASIIADRPLALRSAHDHLEEMLTVLHEAGFENDEAVRVFYSLFIYVLGFVVWELPRSGDHDSQTWRQSLQELPPGPYRRLHAAHDALSTTASYEQFLFGLELLIGSIAGRSGSTNPGGSDREGGV
jgi:AcrR family transcriptional regulator